MIVAIVVTSITASLPVAMANKGSCTDDVIKARHQESRSAETAELADVAR